MNTPTLTKRQYDIRLFTVNVAGKLRSGDEVTVFSSVSATAQGSAASSPTGLSVAVASTSITDDTNLHFTCSGGIAGVRYLIVLRYVSTSETKLESIVYVEVI